MVQEENTTKPAPADEQRRNFLKGAAATGVAAIGLGAFSGGAAAQNVRNLQLGDVTVLEGGDLLEIEVRNINILRDIEIDRIVVTLIGGNVEILKNVNVSDNLIFEDKVIEVDISDITLNVTGNDVLVSVAVLSDQDVVAFGDTIA